MYLMLVPGAVFHCNRCYPAANSHPCHTYQEASRDCQRIHFHKAKQSTLQPNVFQIDREGLYSQLDRTERC